MVTDEILLGIELSKHALEKGISLLGNRDWAPLPSDHSLFSIYENIWLSRARHGGLVESMDILLHSATQKLTRITMQDLASLSQSHHTYRPF
jgi:hypothetical protein